MCYLWGTGQKTRTNHLHPVIFLCLLAAIPRKGLGYFLGDTKAVLNGCEDHWTLQASMPTLDQITVCVDIRVVVPGPWVAFSYSSVHAPRPELGLEGDQEALYGWLLRVRHRFPLQLSLAKWHRVCLRRDVLRNSFSLEVDGETASERTVIAHAIPPSGSLWLGCQPRDRLIGSALGGVELYLFRMWADLDDHGLCEDGTLIGWNTLYWGLTSPRARQKDPTLHCAFTDFVGRMFAPGAVVPTTTPSPVATPVTQMSNQMLNVTASLVNCDISQLCSTKDAYFWTSIMVEAEVDNKTEQDVDNLVSKTFSCHNPAGFRDVCRDNRHLQVVQVTCKQKHDIRNTTCDVLLQLSEALPACELQRAGVSALQHDGGGQIRAKIVADVERVGRDLCGDMAPPSGRLVRCTSASSLDEVCQAKELHKLTCSVIEPNSSPAPRPSSQSCREEPRFCDCATFCNSASQFFAIKININSTFVNIGFLKTLLSHNNMANVCTPGPMCPDISKHYKGAYLDCHETPQRLYSCMVILEVTGPVNSCTLNEILQQLIDRNVGIMSQTPLTRMVVCGPPGSPVHTLLASNLTWVSDLLISDVCQPGNTLFQCDTNEKFGVLLTDGCHPTSQQNTTQPSVAFRSINTSTADTTTAQRDKTTINSTQGLATEPVLRESSQNMTVVPSDSTIVHNTTFTESTLTTTENTEQENVTKAQYTAEVQLSPVKSSSQIHRTDSTFNTTTLSPTFIMYNGTTISTPTPVPDNANIYNTTVYNITTFSSQQKHRNNTTPTTNTTVKTFTQTAANSYTTVVNSYTAENNLTTDISSNNSTHYNVTAATNIYKTEYSGSTVTSPSNTLQYNVTTAAKTHTTLYNTSTTGNNRNLHNGTTTSHDTTEYNTSTTGNNRNLHNGTTTSHDTTEYNTSTTGNNRNLHNGTTTSHDTTEYNTSTTGNNRNLHNGTTTSLDTTEYNTSTTGNNRNLHNGTTTSLDTTEYNTSTTGNNRNLHNGTTTSHDTTEYNTSTTGNNRNLHNGTTTSHDTTEYNTSTTGNNRNLHNGTTTIHDTTEYNTSTTGNNRNLHNGTTTIHDTTEYNTSTTDNNRNLHNGTTTIHDTTEYNTSTTGNNRNLHNGTLTITTMYTPSPKNKVTTTNTYTPVSNNYTAPYNITSNSKTQHSNLIVNNITIRTVTPPNYNTTEANTFTLNYNHTTSYNLTMTINNYTTGSNNYSTGYNFTVASATTHNATENIFTPPDYSVMDNKTTVSITTAENTTTVVSQNRTVRDSEVDTVTNAKAITGNSVLDNMTSVFQNTTKVTSSPLSKQTRTHNTTPATHNFTTSSQNVTTSSTTPTGASPIIDHNETGGGLTAEFNPTAKGPGVNITTGSFSLGHLATASTTTSTTNGSWPTPINITATTLAHNTTTVQTVTGASKPGTIQTPTAETTEGQKAQEEQANKLLDQTRDASRLNSSQVAQLATQLEKLLDGPTVSQAVGQMAVNIISNLMEVDPLALSPSSNRLIGVVDELGAKLTVAGDSEIISSNSLVLAVRRVDGTKFPPTSVDIFNTDNVQFQFLSRPKSSGSALGSVFLPSSLTMSLSPEEQQQASRVQFTFYTKSALFWDATLSNQTLVSPILGSSVANLSISNLTENIWFKIRNINPIHANYSATCAFWDFTLNGGSGGWSSAGCFLINATLEDTTCSCSHLTSFAILLDLSRQGVTDHEQAQILTFITYIGCGISAVFLAATLLTYLAFQKLLRDIPAKILVQLCLSLLLLNLVFLLDTWLALYPAIGLCISTAFFLHYFLLTSFTWAGIEALHMYLSVVQVFTPYLSRYMLKVSLLGWGFPLVVVIVVISVDKDNYGLVSYAKYTDGTSDKFCWIRNDIAFYVGVVAYFVLIFALCLLVFIMVMVQLTRIKKQNPHNQSPNRGVLTDLRSITGLIILLGLTWGFALFAWGPLLLPFVYLFSIFNSLQGFFVFVFHCAVKENVRRQWRTHLCCGRLRLVENSELSRSATRSNRNTAAATASTLASHFTSRSSSVISDGTNSSGSVFADSGISDSFSNDVILNEIHRRNLPM